ncbi:S8 family serine peptidase [Planococcus sp. YIM B11945]|uniref:S8 family serine peptidase n=1 Tax=Planococcus sp. YIM B11945 TaxID=3435410 RepID=UPI003D7CBB4D
MKKTFPLMVISFLLFFFVLSTDVVADGYSIEPEIAKTNTSLLFDSKKEFDSQELIVKFEKDTTADQKKRLLGPVRGTEISSLLGGEVSLVSLPKGANLKAAADLLLKQKAIEFVQPNYEIEQTYTPKDSGFKKQWHLNKIQTPKAWDSTKGSSGITVAVIDSGVQTSHPDLKGKIVSPYNAVTGGKTFPVDEHGTHVAGIIAASINNKGVAGVAPNVKIMPVNVFQGSGAYSYDVITGIVYATDKGANVINMSLGGYYYDYTYDLATAYAKDKGVTVIAAAGNDNTSATVYPAAYSSVIGVSATNKNDRITYFSNYGSYIDVSAPGEDIYSTVTGSSYDYMDGTSMAAPVVSGVAALVLSKNPLLSPDQVESILESSSKDLGKKGWDSLFGAGRVDAAKALSKTTAPLSSITGSSTFTASGKNKTGISFTAQKGKTVSVFVEDSKGKLVKKLINPKKWGGGKASASWDGKMENGLYAPNATYTVVAKLTNGKENVYKKKTVKLTNKVKPTIKVGSSAVFSPPVKGKLAVSYELNQKTSVTAKVYDSKNKVVKTLFTNKSVNTKTGKAEWNGTNSKNQKVKDGTYKLVLSGVGANKIKLANANMSIKIDTTKPTASTSVLASPFKMDGKSKDAVKVTFKEKVTMTAYVTTDKGVKVKRLTNNKSYNAGVTTLKWDGKNDNGKWVAEGKYLYQVEVKDAVGNLLTAKSKIFDLQDWQKPVITAAKEFALKKEGNASFSYTLNKPASVTVEILKDGQVARTIEMAAAKKAGANAFVWDGKSQDGVLLADGTYQYKITAVDNYKTSVSATGTMKVVLTEVEVEYPSVVQLYDDYGSDVFYKLSQDATVTVEIRDSYDDPIRTIQLGSQQAGKNSFYWDGLDEDGYNYWYSDWFTYVIKATNAAGNVKTVTGKISNDELPNWLVSQTYSFTPLGDYWWENTKLNLEIDVKTPVTMDLFVFDEYYSDAVKDFKTYNLVNEMNKKTYTKLDTDLDYYIILYTDALGNEYVYEIDEYDYTPYSSQKMKAAEVKAMRE